MTIQLKNNLNGNDLRLAELVLERAYSRKDIIVYLKVLISSKIQITFKLQKLL